MLLGGGDWPVPAFRWFVEQMGHGHLVILRASGTDDLQTGFPQRNRWRGVGRDASCSIARRRPAILRVLEILQRADGIFFGGGDQSNYVRYFKGTPLNALLDDARARRQAAAAAPAPGSPSSAHTVTARWMAAACCRSDAMKNPLGSGCHAGARFPTPAVPLAGDHRQPLRDPRALGHGCWCSSAGSPPSSATPAITGIGIDEKAALCIETRAASARVLFDRPRIRLAGAAAARAGCARAHAVQFSRRTGGGRGRREQHRSHRLSQ